MVKESSISVDLDDPRIGKIADVISNKTSKKILQLLAEQELSEGDISAKLGMPINTVEYNLKKLIGAGLVDKVEKFFWSVKGKKISLYTVSNKKIIISPKSNAKGFMATILVSALGALGIKYYYFQKSAAAVNEMANGAADFTKSAAESAGAAGPSSLTATSAADSFVNASTVLPQFWMWFFIGAMFSLVVLYLVMKLYRRNL